MVLATAVTLGLITAGAFGLKHLAAADVIGVILDELFLTGDALKSFSGHAAGFALIFHHYQYKGRQLGKQD